MKLTADLSTITIGGLNKENLADTFAQYVYSNILNDGERVIYEEALNLFPKHKCYGSVLSILSMQYPKYTKYEASIDNAITQHSKLYTPFEIDREMCWTFSKIFDISIEKTINYCQQKYNNFLVDMLKDNIDV